ncbi:putative DNA-binding transcriptional regulator YafY [Roseiarcus fermentans]|uniref:Putative DNA-binding transcriptional regulator YafY n=1 Tax=Roseiarcus fermentans TaxID=1473586 RepID=A0A366EMW5_9HYPH|nr:YafY family protein [Roseiarcus fermentans]RBP02829.1 putative DNA-binding transcriptional regulator YafY [Roseiarcus fermentans]
MARAGRLLDLMQALRRRRAPTPGAALADELGVSLRTLYRDIATLQAQGAAIEGEAGLGYVLRAGFELPPLMVTLAEIEALALGARWVEGRGDEALARAAQDALAKIAAVLPPDRADALDWPTLLAGATRAGDAERAALPLVRQALTTERKLGFGYADKAGRATDRVVWPVAVGFFESVMMLAAWCETREAFRHFRLDRMAGVAVLPARPPKSRRALLKDWRRDEGL